MLATNRMALLGTAAAALCIAGTACRPSARADHAYRDTVGLDTNRAAVKHDSLTDKDIAAIVLTANSLDSASGVFASTHAHNGIVRSFAQRMVHDHGAANRQTARLVHTLNPNTTPVDNDDIRHMRTDAQHEQTDLARDSGQAFDKAYIDHEVDDHQHVLDKLDHDLIPHAQNAQLKSLLTSTRTVIQSHLTEAKRIQDQLKHEH